MRILGFMNGWRDAPHCWRTYLLRPIQIDRTPAWTSVSVFGLVWFFEKRVNAND